MSKRKRTLGTSVEVLEKAAAELRIRFPREVAEIILKRNGAGPLLAVPDESNPRTLTNNLIRERQILLDYVGDLGRDPEAFRHLIPILPPEGDWYCLDTSRPGPDGAFPVVFLSHETLEVADRAHTLREFIERLESGEFVED